MRRKRVLGWSPVAAMVLAATLGTAGMARGMCAGPRAFLAPASGAVLPENPRLFLFVPSGHEVPEVTASTAAGERAFELTRLSEVRSFTVFQVDVLVDAGSLLTMRIDAVESQYAVTDPFPRPLEPVSVSAVEPEIFSWTCSHQETQNVHLSSSSAPAFRVEFSDSESSFAAGRRQSFIVPASMTRFFDPESRYSDPEAAVLELGYVNCLGETLQWTAKSPLHVGLIALHSDGTEEPVLGPPLLVSPPERSLTRRLREDYWLPALYWWRYNLETLVPHWP